MTAQAPRRAAAGQPRSRATTGFPDDLFIRDGKLLVVETKTERGKLTPAQVRWLKAWRLVEDASCGAVEVYLWRPSNWSSGEIERRLA